ncbi:uncharacterized protein ACBR49_003684 [Aulostomus maculatus]
MHLKAMLLTLSFLTTSAYPLHRYPRETTQADLKANQAHERTQLSKDVDKIYKNHIDGIGLYIQEDDYNKTPVVEDMQRKLNMEYERLRAQLHQELAELRHRLALSPVHLSSTLTSIRERLAPLTQQLQSSLSSNTQGLCGHLTLYLQGLEVEVKPALHQETFLWINQTLDQSSSQITDIISDFQTKTTRAIEHLKEISASEGEAVSTGLLQEFSARFRQEVSSMKVEAQNSVGALKVELATLIETAQSLRAKATASMDRFCQHASLLSHVFQARMEKLFLGLEEELEVQAASSLSHSLPSEHSGGSLQEDFSVKLSALIQDILHSVQ